jgi:chromosome segregation protein
MCYLLATMERVRIHSLTLKGFKSFPDETEFTFPGDVCSIIGPNGCGKSNIVDAILWVLGEQSPSLMRLKAMGDVVFSGASGRPPGGVAEVLLKLQGNGDRWQQTDGELVISRRVFRTGPSEYRLNGRSARLRDVFDELAAVGLGTRNYAIIEQGRVGQVLSARPIDRRVLLEEAAGITRYKARRHEAELKLERTRHNLTRLDDVIAEVERSLRQLKRQARQAERYRQLEAELKDRICALHTIEAQALNQERQDLARRRALAQNEVAAAAAALGGAEADLKDTRKGHDGARSELEEVRTEVANLRASRERLEAFLERSADLLANLRSSLDRTTQEEAATSATCATLDRQLADANARTDSLATALDEVEGKVGESADEETGTRERLETAEQRAAELRQELLRVISSLTTTRNQVGELDREQDRLAFTVGKLDQERERLQERRTETRRQYDAASTASRAAAAAAEELDRRRQGLASERATLIEEATAAKHEAESLGHTLWELRHRLAGVDRELARHTAAVDQLSALLPAQSLAGQISDYLHPEAGDAAVLDRVWADWVELPVVHEADLGPDLRTVLSELEGRIRLVMAGDAPEPQATPHPEGARPLLEAAGIAPEHLPWLSRALPPAYQCDDQERARELADAHPEALFLDPDGVLWHGRTMEPPTAGTSLRGALVLRQDKQELELNIADAEHRAEASAARRNEFAVRVDQLEERLGEVNRELVAAEQERARTAAVEESLGHELSRVEQELEAANTEAQRSVRQRQDLVRRRTQVEGEVERLEARSLEAEQAVDEADAAVDALRDSAATAQRSLERWGAEARLAQERLAAARAESNRIEEEQRTAHARPAREPARRPRADRRRACRNRGPGCALARPPDRGAGAARLGHRARERARGQRRDPGGHGRALRAGGARAARSTRAHA